MALYVASGKALATAANSNVIAMRAASTDRVRIREITVFIEAATALNLAIFRTTVLSTAGTQVVGAKEDGADGAGTLDVRTVPTSGTVDTVALRRAFLPAVAGSAVVFACNGGEELLIPTSGELVLRNDSALGPAITWQIRWEE